MLSVTNNGRQNMFPSHIGPQVGILKATKVMETRKPRNGKLEQRNCPWDPSDPCDFDLKILEDSDLRQETPCPAGR